MHGTLSGHAPGAHSRARTLGAQAWGHALGTRKSCVRPPPCSALHALSASLFGLGGMRSHFAQVSSVPSDRQRKSSMLADLERPRQRALPQVKAPGEHIRRTPSLEEMFCRLRSLRPDCFFPMTPCAEAGHDDDSDLSGSQMRWFCKYWAADAVAELSCERGCVNGGLTWFIILGGRCRLPWRWRSWQREVRKGALGQFG